MYKYKNLCETNDPFHFKEKIEEKYLNIEEIGKRVATGEDIIGRQDSFNKISLDNSFPEYLIKNKNLFKDWIL